MGRWRYRGGKDSEQLEKKGRMRGRGKRSTTSKIDLTESFEIEESRWPPVENGFAARVVEVHKRYCFVSPEPEIGDIKTNDVWLGRVARKYLTADRDRRNFFSAGDRVYCRPAEDKELDVASELPQCVVENMQPRHSKIARVDPIYGGREHVLAANVDLLVIVASYLAPRVKWGLIDRYLVLAETQQIETCIILNKRDLLEDEKQERPDFFNECEDRADYYRSLGYRVYSICANSADAGACAEVSAIKKELSGRVSILSGHSGVGKSSVINLFEPEIVQEVEANSDIFYKGRHTTTYASFIKLGSGGYVIDTPGIRSFLIQGSDPITLGFGYRDFRPLQGGCKFRECRHIDEPGCRVLAAVERGDIPEWRYKNYIGILLGTSGREGRLREQD